MDDKKDLIHGGADSEGGTAPRARNRTVMLTPEMTGQLRSRMVRDALQREVDEGVQSEPSVHEEVEQPLQHTQPVMQHSFQPVESHDHGFVRPRDTAKIQAASLVHAEEPAPHAHSAVSYAASGYTTQPEPEHQPVQHVQQKLAAPHPVEEEEPSEGVCWSKKTPIVGFLVSYDREENGEVIELRQGRLMITSEKIAHGDYLIIHDETVSPMHAILRITASGEMQLLDQLSEHGTKIRKLGSEEEDELSGDRCTVGHGDLITFGKRSYHVCLVVRNRD